MFRQSWLIVVLAATGFIAGCDSRTSSPAPVSAPTTAPTTVPAATQPLTTAPTTVPTAEVPSSQLTIDGQPYKFAAAKLRVSKSGQHVIARLYTDDPKSALEDDFKGNNYDLQMKLEDIRDPQQIYMSVWQFKAPSHEYVDAPYGIFLNGMKYQLQPLDVTARFLGTMFSVQISLDGQFLMFDESDKSGAPRTVYVKGSLLAQVEYKD